MPNDAPGEPDDPTSANALTMQESRVVVVLAKAPVPGRVKTRLMPPAAPEGAAAVAAAALLDTLDAAAAVPGAALLVALEGDLSAAVRGEEIGDAVRGAAVVTQRGESLGERIAAAHDDAAGLFPGAATVQIGMDTPQVTAALLEDAFLRVEREADAALGLAEDGGWWALALRDPRHAHLVVDVPTSRDDTGRRTLDALRAGLPGASDRGVLQLPTLSDVDTVDDAAAVSDLAPHGRFARAVGDHLLVSGGLPR